MKWFSNLKIKIKLISCFVILAAFTGIVGFIGINNMRIINSRGDEMYANNFVPAQKLASIQKALLDIRYIYLMMMYEPDISKLQNRVEEINKLAEQNNKTISEYKPTIITKKERDLFEEFEKDLLSYRKIRSENIAVIQAGRHDEAIERLSEFAKARDKVEQSIQELVKYNIDSAQNKSNQNSEDFESQSIVMIVIIITGIILAVGLGLVIANLISKPLHLIVGAANQIADGNLDVEIEVDTKDEVGILGQAFKKMTANINEVMSNISSAAEQVASGSKQVSDSSIELSQGATEQASSIEQLTASLEEISSQTRMNADNASEANNLAENVKSNAMQGNRQMKEMLKAMDEINDSSSSISKIIKVIDEIAFQTNILALNAAVEAARAGQHGKGFAVVAEEVRNLAARSANAAKETTTMIEGSIKKVEDGTKIANDTAVALNNIVGGVSKVASLVGEIAIASNEQASGIAQVNQGIMQVSEVVQTNSATSEESAAASEELASQAELLQDQVARFKLQRFHRTTPVYRKFDDLNPEVLKMLEQMNNDKRVPSAKESNIGANSPASKKIVLSDREFGKY